MNKKIPELLIIFALFVSPLLHSSIESTFQTRRMWSWCLLISCAIIVFFSTYLFRVQKILFPLIITTCALLVSSFIFALYPVNSLALYFVALVFLVCLAIHQILHSNPRNTVLIVCVILGCLSIYAQWGIVQFIIQQDLGMSRLGESILNENTPGVASFYIGPDKFIRAYGPFAHANSLGGVLLLGIILIYRHVSKLRSPLFITSLLFVMSLGIIASFSRTAILGLLLVIILFIWKKRFLLLLPILIGLILFSSLLFYRSLDTNSVAAHDRLEGLDWFLNMANAELLVRGVGLGNYTTSLTTYLKSNTITHEAWDRAPIHSVPLFLISEMGLLICIPFFIFLGRYIHVNKLWVLIAILPALFLDHYFATQLAPAIFLITSAQLVVQ